MKRVSAQRIADQVVELLEPQCTRIEIAGSLRRERDDVGDVELVCVPRYTIAKQLFDGANLPTLEESDLHRYLNQETTRRGSWLKRDTIVLRWGGRYRRLAVEAAAGRIAVELFIVGPPAEWGPLLAIRTGPADFSKLLVTPRAHGGAMPDEHRQHEGQLLGPGGPVPCPEESHYFAALGVPLWPPAERTFERLRAHLRTVEVA